MKLKTILPVTFAVLTGVQFPGLAGSTGAAEPAPDVFYCQQLVNDPKGVKFVTYAVRKDGSKTVPLFKWKSQEFNDSGYTPERRCQEVTNRLNKSVRDNDGKLDGLFLTVGKVNRYLVLCNVTNTSGKCNKDNVLFTFSARNRRNPTRVLASIVNFSISGSGSAIFESGGGNRSEEFPYINLAEVVEKAAIAEDNTNPAIEQPPSTPNPGFESGM
jgi:hypothetical protein